MHISPRKIVTRAVAALAWIGVFVALLPDNLLLFPHGVIDTPPPSPGPEQLAAGLKGKTVIASYGFLLPHKGVP